MPRASPSPFSHRGSLILPNIGEKKGLILPSSRTLCLFLGQYFSGHLPVLEVSLFTTQKPIRILRFLQFTLLNSYSMNFYVYLSEVDIARFYDYSYEADMASGFHKCSILWICYISKSPNVFAHQADTASSSFMEAFLC